MKLTSSLLALAGAALITTTASAATTTFSQGDLVIGFYDSNSTVTTGYEVDLGSVASIGAASSGAQTWNLGSDLTAIYGANWNNQTVTALQWGVVGYVGNVALSGSIPAKGLFVTDVETSPGTINSPIGNTPTSGQISTVGGKINNMTSGSVPSGGFNGATLYGSTNDAANIATSLANSFKSQSNQGGGNFALGPTGGSNSANGVLNNFASGTAGSVSDLDYVVNSSNIYVAGTFSFNDSGVLTYSAVQAVPEPSSYALGVLAFLLFWVLKRRQSVA